MTPLAVNEENEGASRSKSGTNTRSYKRRKFSEEHIGFTSVNVHNEERPRRMCRTL